MASTQMEDQVLGLGNFSGFDENEKVSFSSLSEMTGFPVDFIKKELLLETEPVSMVELRKSVLRYLEVTAETINT